MTEIIDRRLALVGLFLAAAGVKANAKPALKPWDLVKQICEGFRDPANTDSSILLRTILIVHPLEDSQTTVESVDDQRVVAASMLKRLPEHMREILRNLERNYGPAGEAVTHAMYPVQVVDDFDAFCKAASEPAGKTVAENSKEYYSPKQVAELANKEVAKLYKLGIVPTHRGAPKPTF